MVNGGVFWSKNSCSARLVTKLEGEGKRVIKQEAERWDLEVRWLLVMTSQVGGFRECVGLKLI